jgi:hypothetical protein
VVIDSIDWSDGRIREGYRILGPREGLHQGRGYDVTDLERFVVFSSFVEFPHHDVKFIGLIYFCMDGMKAIRTVIDTLRIPSLETRVLRLFISDVKTELYC